MTESPAPLRILVLQEHDADAALVAQELARTGVACELTRVSSGAGFHGALAGTPPDVILSDNQIEGFSGMAALRAARERAPGVPFIFVSGTIGEEAAIEAMREGATDCVLKDRLARLGPVFERVRSELGLRRELAAMRAQHLNAARLEAMGRMAGAVAHDFRNILTVMMGHAELLLMRSPAGDASRERLGTILEAGQRGVELAAQLLAFGRHGSATSTDFDPAAEARRTEAMFRSILTRGIELSIDAEPGAGRIYADPGHFGQILLNLLVNARDAMPDGGRVVIRIAPRDLAEPGTFVASAAPAGAYVQVSVTDCGVGMSDDVRQRIFEPYFTTKPADRGTGLGLAIVFSLVRGAGGHLEVETAPGRGTTFRMLFPRTGSPDTGAGARRTILVAEDDATLREQIRQMLELSGYEVLVAADGQEALEQAGRRPDGIALLLADVHMPRLGGPLLAGTIRASWPRTRILLMTGDPARRDDGAAYPLLGKPFRPHELLTGLQAALAPAH